MPKNKKVFIGKDDKAVRFSLVNRSQKDPLIVSDASQHVLVPLSNERLDPEARKEKQQNYGIYYDDNYDYLQHLRNSNFVGSLEQVGEHFRITKDGSVFDLTKQQNQPSSSGHAPKLMLPAELFETEGVELDTSLLNQAASNSDPKICWDSDIVAALDDEFDFDDPDALLEDDFIAKANAVLSDEEEEPPDAEAGDEQAAWPAEAYATRYAASNRKEADCEDEFGENFGAEAEETRSRFTNYSMTSSVIRRTAGLKLIDDMFERVYEEYDEEELGSGSEDLSSCNDDEGMIDPNSERMLEMAAEYQHDKEMERKLTEKILQTAEKFEMEHQASSSDEEPLERIVCHGGKNNWDCESILTTTSTLYNHPTVIKAPRKAKLIQVNPKTGMPCAVNANGVTAKQLKHLDGDNNSVVSEATLRSRASTYRPKKLETAEQRRLRKQAVRCERKERREEKKATKLAFRSEHKLQLRSKLNANVNNGVKLV